MHVRYEYSVKLILFQMFNLIYSLWFEFVSKIFLGTSFNEIVADAKTIFKEVKIFKPKSSRKESKESFIICKILR